MMAPRNRFTAIRLTMVDQTVNAAPSKSSYQYSLINNPEPLARPLGFLKAITVLLSCWLPDQDGLAL